LFRIVTKNTMNTILKTIAITLISVFTFQQKIFSACELYNIDFITGQLATAQYQLSCGTVSSAQWSVNDTLCVLTTSPVSLGGTLGNMVSTPLTVEILTSASTTICNDYVIIQYQIDNDSWVTQDSIPACEMTTSVYSYPFNVVCGDTSAIKVRVIMYVIDDGGGSASEKLRIRDGGICVGTPVPIGPLPIELVGLTAKQENEKIKISWATASEKDNDYFLVEKSIDAKNFESLSLVEGSGNSTIVKYYDTYDHNPIYGVAYYRLKHVDYNGGINYSKTVSLKFDFFEPNKFDVLSNPCNGIMSVGTKECQKKEILVVLYDMMGNRVYSKVTLQDSGKYSFIALDTSSKLPPGVYLVIGSSENEMYNQKLVINESSSNDCVFMLACNH